MELLFILPWLLGYGLYSLFTSDGGSSSGGNDDNGDNGDDGGDNGGGGNTVDPNNTLITGTSQGDAHNGGTGDDFILGNSGVDTIFGNDGDDLLLGEFDADLIYGGQGYDTISGGASEDTIFGENGLDMIIGGSGNDLIYGGAGADTLVGSSGADTIDGGTGDDLISGFDVGSGVDGGQDGDHLANNLLDTPSNAISRALALADYAVDTYGSAVVGDPLARLSSALSSGNFHLSDDLLIGGDGNDTIFADYSDTITGGAGNDVLAILSDGADEAVTVTDLNVTQDVIRITVPNGTNTAVTLVDGATPAIGVSVVVAGDVVAILQGLTAAQIPANYIVVVAQT